MIKVFRATKAKRKRDRDRLVLKVGNRAWHMSNKEAVDLARQLLGHLGRRSALNRRRAKTAEKTLKEFARIIGSKFESTEELMTDLMANLMHLACNEELDWTRMCRSATCHFQAELFREEI